MQKAVITGMGVVSPIGNDVDTFWASIKAGKSGVGPITRFDATNFDSKVAAEVKDFDPSLFMERKDARKMALFTQFAVAASVQAWKQAGLEGSGVDLERTAVVLGNGIGGIEIFEQSHAKLLESGPSRMLPLTVPMMIGNEAAGNVAIHFGIKGPVLTTVTACASGSDALGQALDMIRSGRADVVVAGGTEGATSAFAVGAFCMLKALSTAYNDDPTKASRPFDAARDGFVIGEGAGIMVLESLSHARKRGAPVLGTFLGFGMTGDASSIAIPEPEGRHAARAMSLAASDGGINVDDIQYVNAHGTSTSANDAVETKAIRLAFGRHADALMVSSTKSMIGHTLGAAGAIEAIVTVLSLRDGVAPPTINLETPDPACDLDYVPGSARRAPLRHAISNSFGFGGQNVSVLFGKP